MPATETIIIILDKGMVICFGLTNIANAEAETISMDSMIIVIKAIVFIRLIT